MLRDAAYLTSRPLLPYNSDLANIPSPVPVRITEAEKTTATEAAAPAPATTPLELPSVAAEQSMPVTDDTRTIRETLERYRRAYSGLDAPLVHAIYPGVDETALARAFEEVRSQSLQFDSVHPGRAGRLRARRYAVVYLVRPGDREQHPSDGAARLHVPAQQEQWWLDDHQRVGEPVGAYFLHSP